MEFFYLIILLSNGIFLVINQSSADRNVSKTPSHKSTGENKAHQESLRAILFVMCCLLAGVAIHFGSKEYHYPYTVGCFLFGVIVGLMEMNEMFVQKFTGITRMDPSDLLMTFLPILIFESSFGMDAHMFFKALPQCLILAVLGFLFCTALTAVFAKFALSEYGWSWITAMAFGTIVSATDPVAVVALLKEMNMPHTFTVLIEGESLLNDGVAIVLYEMLSHKMVSQKPFEASATAVELLKTCLGAPTLGYLLGKVTEHALIRIYVSPVSEKTVTLVMAYVTYFVAERLLGISAILAVVLYGVTLSASKMCISPESEKLVNTNWRLLCVYANTLIFMFVGILVTASFSQHFTSTDAWLILITYLALTFFRSLMIVIFYPVLRKTGYGLNWKEGILLSWGGLRGAIGLALSLMLATNSHLPPSVNAKKVLIQVSGIIVLTLIVNANTVKYIMRITKFQEITLVNRLSMGNAIASVTEMMKKSLRICKREWKFMKADWEWVSSFTELEDPYAGGLHGDDPNMRSLCVPYGTCRECLAAVLPIEPSADEMHELKEATRKKVLRALKGNLWKQFRKGLLQRKSLRLLCVAIDNASDTTKSYLKAEEVIAKLMRVSKLTHWLETKLSHLLRKMRVKKDVDFELEVQQVKISGSGGFRSWCLWIYFSRWFEPLIFVVIVLNIIHISYDIYLAYTGRTNQFAKVLDGLKIFFVVFYTWEMMVKISALKWKLFVKHFWNKIDFGISTLAVLVGILEIIISKHLLLYKIVAYVRILIIVRIFRYYYIIVNIFTGFLSVIRNYASSDLYYIYDTGRGFLFASEAVLRNIEMIIDFGPCAKTPMSVCEKNIRQMLDALDEFERDYPAVVVALKSNRAARRILNRVTNILDHLQKRSLILEENATEMKSILFKMKKSVAYASRARHFERNIQNILEEVDWISPELAKEIDQNHTIVTFKSGETVQKVGHPHEFVFIIAKGILKVAGEKRELEIEESNGKLPNTDSTMYFQDLKNGSFYDYLTATETVGLLGFLQKTPCVTATVCEKDSELIRIDYSFLDDILGKTEFDNLTFCMWKSVSLKIAIQILKKQRFYKMYTDEDLHSHLQKAILPNLTDVASVEIPSAVEDMVVIQGRIKDTATEVEFVAPSYIPSTSRHLELLENVNRRQPIIMLLLIKKNYSFPTLTNWVPLETIPEFMYYNQQKISKYDLRYEREVVGHHEMRRYFSLKVNGFISLIFVGIIGTTNYYSG